MRRLLLALAAFSATAMEQPPSRAGDHEIIVEGQPLTRADIARVVASISNPESIGGFDSQYPRWAARICVLVGGFPRDGGQFIADRIGEVARSLKLNVGQSGCSPNIFILATHDPAKLIAGLRLKRQGLVSGPDVAIVTRIQRSHDAIRWIGATTVTGPFHVPTQAGGFKGTGRAIPQNTVFGGGSRLQASTGTFLTRETIIVDTRQTDGLNYGQLADYLTLVALAQISPHAAAPGVASILSLFPRGDRAPTGLTTFDKAYLTALYRIDSDALGPVQTGQLKSGIQRALQPKAPQATASNPAASATDAPLHPNP